MLGRCRFSLETVGHAVILKQSRPRTAIPLFLLGLVAQAKPRLMSLGGVGVVGGGGIEAGIEQNRLLNALPEVGCACARADATDIVIHVTPFMMIKRDVLLRHKP